MAGSWVLATEGKLVGPMSMHNFSAFGKSRICTECYRPKAAIATMQYDTRLPVDHQANPCNPMVSYSGISRLRSNTVRTTCITSTTPAPSITTSWIGRLYLSLLDGLKLGCLPKKHSAKSIFKRHKFWHVTSASVVFNRSPKAENDPERTLRKSFR